MTNQESQDALDLYLSDAELYGVDMVEVMKEFEESFDKQELKLDASEKRIKELNKEIKQYNKF